jgi:hypothetical protein
MKNSDIPFEVNDRPGLNTTRDSDVVRSTSRRPGRRFWRYVTTRQTGCARAVVRGAPCATGKTRTYRRVG